MKFIAAKYCVCLILWSNRKADTQNDLKPFIPTTLWRFGIHISMDRYESFLAPRFHFNLIHDTKKPKQKFLLVSVCVKDTNLRPKIEWTNVDEMLEMQIVTSICQMDGSWNERIVRLIPWIEMHFCSFVTYLFAIWIVSVNVWKYFSLINSWLLICLSVFVCPCVGLCVLQISSPHFVECTTEVFFFLHWISSYDIGHYLKCYFIHFFLFVQCVCVCVWWNEWKSQYRQSINHHHQGSLCLIRDQMKWKVDI